MWLRLWKNDGAITVTSDVIAAEEADGLQQEVVQQRVNKGCICCTIAVLKFIAAYGKTKPDCIKKTNFGFRILRDMRKKYPISAASMSRY